MKNYSLVFKGLILTVFLFLGIATISAFSASDGWSQWYDNEPITAEKLNKMLEMINGGVTPPIPPIPSGSQCTFDASGNITLPCDLY